MTAPIATRHATGKPPWLKVRFPGGEKFNWIRDQARGLSLSTVCEEARCPNIGECWNSGTATFMLMGDTCTRGCRFCSVNTAKLPDPLDSQEPQKLAATIHQMRLEYVVLTTVDRDDLPDQGANHLAECLRVIRQKNPRLLVEMLAPDFRGQTGLMDVLLKANPHVLAHNVETVQRLTHPVRDPRAGYQQSLDMLKHARQSRPDVYTKSSLMLGLGETREEVIQTMEDMRKVDVSFLTLGQYLQPSKKQLKVERFVTPEEFAELEQIGLELGFDYVASGPLVRSSYKAAEFYIQSKLEQKQTACG